jgi:hypothetical protein
MDGGRRVLKAGKRFRLWRPPMPKHGTIKNDFAGIYLFNSALMIAIPPQTQNAIAKLARK